jgi:hypothetical protein
MDHMTSTSQFFLQIAASVLISVVVWVVSTVLLVLLGAILAGGLVTPSFRKPVVYGSIVGLLHGALTGTIIYWQRSESVISFALASVAVTEILIIFGGVAWYLYRCFSPVTGGTSAPPPAFHEYFGFVWALLIWFVILSAILLLPSIIAGVANKLIFTSSASFT